MNAQAQLNFSFPPNPFKSGTQNHALFEWLRAYGRISLHEIHHVLKQDTARIRVDIKPYLRKHGYDIYCIRFKKGLTEYVVQTL